MQIDEYSETTMTRFLQGLRRDIAQKVETMDYFNLNEMFHKACQAEQHVKEALTWQNRGQRGNQPPTYVQQLRQNFPANNQRRTTFEPRRNAPTTSASQGSNQKNTPTQGNSGKQVSNSSSSGSKAESSKTLNVLDVMVVVIMRLIVLINVL